ncbi:MAG: DUF86 domain-containing protein [Selenomonadaceae bacterium]|nr:DUF86 domain-containing protein [Selenomonadaceae bacterium]
MRKNRRNVNRIVIQKMFDYCKEIENFRGRFNATCEVYSSDSVFRLACDMCVYQIGELTTRLSEDFKAQHSEIPWHEIKGLRNLHAHEYEKIDLGIMWEVLTKNIPELKAQLEKILAVEESDDSQV